MTRSEALETAFLLGATGSEPKRQSWASEVSALPCRKAESASEEAKKGWFLIIDARSAFLLSKQVDLSGLGSKTCASFVA